MDLIEPQDVSIKLKGTLVLYGSTLATVVGNADESGYLHLRDMDDNDMTANIADIELRKPTLGYFNILGSSVYMSYDPSRRYQMGVSANNIDIAGEANVVRFINQGSLIKALAPYLYGIETLKYPTFKDAVSSIQERESSNLAISNKISLSRYRTGILIFYKNIKVGKVIRNKPVSTSEKFHINQHQLLGV